MREWELDKLNGPNLYVFLQLESATKQIGNFYLQEKENKGHISVP